MQTAALFRAELGAVRWGPVAGLAVGSGALLGADAAGWLGGPGGLSLWVGLGVLAAALAFVMGDPSRAVLAACPVTGRQRLGIRLAVWVAGAAVWTSYRAATTRWSGSTELDASALLVSGAGVLVLTGTVTVAAHNRAALDEPGTAVGSAAVIGVLTMLIVQSRLGDVRPLSVTELTGESRVLWSVVIVIAIGALVWATSDPWRSG
jgi:hypothetical protein